MAWIRVSVSNLKSNSNKIFASASELQKISRAVQNAANSAPSYNGQFGPKVKAIGMDMSFKGMQQSYELQDKAGNLKVRAEKFENADKKSIFSNIRNWFNNLFGKNTLLQSLFTSLFKPSNSSIQPSISSFSTKDTVQLRSAFYDYQIDGIDNKYPNTRKELEEKQKELEKAAKEERKRKAIEQGLPSNWKDSWYEKWYEHNCPPVGTDAYLGFLSQCYTSFNYPVAIIRNGDEYCVFIRGTDGNIVDWDASPDDDENCWGNNIPAMEGRQTGYELSVLNLIRSSIPKGSKINLVGHSQGGIIANNCVANLINEYNIYSVLTFGSPPPLNYDLPDSIRRRYYGDKGDRVVGLTTTVLTEAKLKYPELWDEFTRLNEDKYNQITWVDRGVGLHFDHDIHTYTQSKLIQKRKSSFNTYGEFEVVSKHKRIENYDSELVKIDATLGYSKYFISWSGDIVDTKKLLSTQRGSGGGRHG